MTLEYQWYNMIISHISPSSADSCIKCSRPDYYWDQRSCISYLYKIITQIKQFWYDSPFGTLDISGVAVCKCILYSERLYV